MRKSHKKGHVHSLASSVAAGAAILALVLSPVSAAYLFQASVIGQGFGGMGGGFGGSQMGGSFGGSQMGGSFGGMGGGQQFDPSKEIDALEGLEEDLRALDVATVCETSKNARAC